MRKIRPVRSSVPFSSPVAQGLLGRGKAPLLVGRCCSAYQAAVLPLVATAARHYDPHWKPRVQTLPISAGALGHRRNPPLPMRVR